MSVRTPTDFIFSDSRYDSICNESKTEIILTTDKFTDQPPEIGRLVCSIALSMIVFRHLLSYLVPMVLCVVVKKLWDFSIFSSKDNTNRLPLPPGGFGLPFLGETLAFILQGHRFFDEKKKTLGNIYKTHILGSPTIRVVGEKAVRQILNGENTKVTSKWPTSARMLLGDGSLSMSTGSAHSVRKKAILRAFSNDALESYTPVVHEIIRKYINTWCNEPTVLGYQEFRKLTFEISCRILLGFEMDEAEMTRLMEAFETLTANLFSLPICVPGTGLHKGMRAREILLQKIQDCIKVKEEHGSPNGFMDALSLIMDVSGDDQLSLKEVKDVGLELLFAGHGTTSSAAATLVLNLNRNPEVMLKTCSELAQYNCAENADCYVPLSTINKLNYTKNVVKEGLRITPPIGAGFRKALCTFELDGYQIPKDWTVVYSIRESHNCSEAVNEPEIFDPDRWSSSTDEKHFLSFGGGRRSCIGKHFSQLVLRVLVIELVRSCTWSVCNPEPEMKTLPVPHPVDQLPMLFSGMIELRTRASTV